MSHSEFGHLLDSVNDLSPDQLRRLRRELEAKIMSAAKPPTEVGQGSLGAMNNAADELDEAVEHAMKLRERAWRLPRGDE